MERVESEWRRGEEGRGEEQKGSEHTPYTIWRGGCKGTGGERRASGTEETDRDERRGGRRVRGSEGKGGR